MKVKKALSGNFHQQYPGNVSAWQPGPDTIQDERSWIGNGKISVVPETFILPALMWVMCGQTANNLNHRLFATQNTNYGLEHFSCLHERVSETSPCSKLPAWAPEWLCWSEPGGDQPGPLGCTDCRIPSAGVGHDSGTELRELLIPIRILLLSSQMSFEEFKADSLSLSRSSVLVGKPRPCQQAYQETASPPCIRRHPKQCIAKQVRVLFIDTAEAKPYFQKL